MKQWQCSVCRYIHEDDTPPEKCPVCGVSSDRFVKFHSEQSPKNDSKASAHKTQKKQPPKKEPESFYEKTMELMAKHHAHPVLVHTPNGILPVTVILYILAWIFDSTLFAKAGFINLVFVILSLPLVIFSGIVEWKKKYNQALTAIFKIKIAAACMTTFCCLISLGWYIIDPLVLSSGKALLFILINILMVAFAGTAGHMGGKLVFKD